jgi:hypothetical protein
LEIRLSNRQRRRKMLTRSKQDGAYPQPGMYF